MGAEALDGERSGNANSLGIDVGAVVEKLELCLRRDRASIAFCRAIRASQKAASGFFAVLASRRRLARDFPLEQRDADTASPLGIVKVASAGASKRTSFPSRPPVVTRNGVLWPRSAAFSRSSAA